MHGKNGLVDADAAIRNKPWAVSAIATGRVTLEGDTVNGKPVARESVKQSGAASRLFCPGQESPVPHAVRRYAPLWKAIMLRSTRCSALLAFALAATALGATATALQVQADSAPLPGSPPACAANVPLSAPNAREVSGLIRAPGAYCLGGDIRRDPQFDVHAGRTLQYAGEGLLKIECAGPCGPLPKPTYLVDLQGNALMSATQNMRGIENDGGGLDVAVRNGRIDVPGTRPPNIGITLRGAADGPGFLVGGVRCWPAQAACADVPAAKADDQRPPQYKASNYLVEHMRIRAGWRGVQLGGGANVLRDSVIEVDSSTAAFLFGPGAVIENNIFIVHGKGERGAFDAALKLRDAHGAVVRNNKFIFKGGWFGKAPAAINLLDSAAVVIENITFDGFDQPVRVNGASNYTVQ